ncbi:MAG: valine--tRNA ligase [Defluviitaleaceae bacterium]|nr:valine--tRNA ligase [Defluviitaleaceae bacterium]
MEIPKTYDKSREAEIYSRWLEGGYFRASAENGKAQGKKPYTIMMPPPNITSQLHMGHALNNTIQDILIRFKRMQGFETLWMPGTDHAAIATEVVVMKALAQQGITKDDLGREGFLEKLWEWNEEYGGRIINQLKKLGCSCDWERLRFTMDEGLSDAVLEAFVRLYEEDKIYRGERLVNWCVKCQTSISDAEVEHKDTEGYLYHFKYPVEGVGHIAFATTRPETMLGDTAIAVAPNDDRYKDLVGKFAEVPMVGRKIPIIEDSYVDPEYGTGVVKITPAHDPNDFEVGNRHDLPRINIMNNDGTINEIGGTAYQGLTREDARKKIIEDMTARGLYIKAEPLTHAVGEHDRCGTAIEPLMQLQWFVKMDALAKPALDAYTSGKLKFNRERFGKTYAHWLENIRDWCISRQLWWGHRIPAYYCENGHITVSKSVPEKCSTCGAIHLTQDEDVLDTWFSSALWPFSTLGWPEKTSELDYFYPTNTLVTDRGIIFFWVARMMFMGEKFMGEIPFTHVFINGTVNDEHGRKMSKSLGNGIDPLEIIDDFGADTLRLMLTNGGALDNDTRFFRERLEPARNFLNKLWNATRFVIMNMDGFNESLEHYTHARGLTQQLEDEWITDLTNRLVVEVAEKLEAHEIGMAVGKIVDFIWDEFCDWYIEMVKPRLYGVQKAMETGDETAIENAKKLRFTAQYTLGMVLDTLFKVLHPITPFITEDLFLALNHATGTPSEVRTITTQPWPVLYPAKAGVVSLAEKSIERMKEAIRAIRAVRTEKQVPPSKKIAIIVVPMDEESRILFNFTKDFFTALSGASHVDMQDPDVAIPSSTVSIVVSGANIYLPMDALVDREKENARLTKEKQKLEQEIARIDSKLANEGFMAKAPEALVAAEREKREDFAAKLAKVNEELKG